MAGRILEAPNITNHHLEEYVSTNPWLWLYFPHSCSLLSLGGVAVKVLLASPLRMTLRALPTSGKVVKTMRTLGRGIPSPRLPHQEEAEGMKRPDPNLSQLL